MFAICVKLNSGEELIGVPTEASIVLTEGETNNKFSKNVTLKNIQVISVHPVGKGQMGIGFIPWAVANQTGDIEINASHITSVYSPNKDIEDSYLQQVTGIQLTR